MPLELQSEDVIRIPLAGTSFSRIVDKLSGSSSASGIVGIGIVGTMVVGQTISTTKDQHYINCFTQRIRNPFTQKETFYVIKRPGWATNSTPDAGVAASAIHIWAGYSGGGGVDRCPRLDEPGLSRLWPGAAAADRGGCGGPCRPGRAALDHAGAD